jgi:hypothetical protein
LNCALGGRSEESSLEEAQAMRDFWTADVNLQDDVPVVFTCFLRDCATRCAQILCLREPSLRALGYAT